MRTAQWSNERVPDRGCMPRAASADLGVFMADRCGRAGMGDLSCASMKNLAVSRGGRLRRGVATDSRESRAGVRRRKVQTVRRQIKQGSYDVEIRLASILDKIFDDLITQIKAGGRPRSGNCGRTKASR
jgi:hypothetical protein